MTIAIAFLLSLLAVAMMAVGFWKWTSRKPSKKSHEKRICSACNKPILRKHRFTGRGTDNVHHIDCAQPTLTVSELRALREMREYNAMNKAFSAQASQMDAQ